MSTRYTSAYSRAIVPCGWNGKKWQRGSELIMYISILLTGLKVYTRTIHSDCTGGDSWNGSTHSGSYGEEHRAVLEPGWLQCNCYTNKSQPFHICANPSLTVFLSPPRDYDPVTIDTRNSIIQKGIWWFSDNVGLVDLAWSLAYSSKQPWL